MIRIELLEDGARNRPVLLIWGTQQAGFGSLQEAFERLATGQIREVDLGQLVGFQSVGGVRLVAAAGPSDLGARKTSSVGSIRWEARSSTWDNIAGLVEAFATAASEQQYRFQWLDQSGDAEVIVSTRRSW